MANPVAKIKAVEVAELVETANNKRAELAIVAEIIVGGQTYTRRFTVIADDHFIHHIGGPLTAEQMEQMVLLEVDKIQSLHDVAAQLAAKKETDLVAEVIARKV